MLIYTSFYCFKVAMDLGGLSILAVAFSLILLPFTLYKAQVSTDFSSSKPRYELTTLLLSRATAGDLEE